MADDLFLVYVVPASALQPGVAGFESSPDCVEVVYRETAERLKRQRDEACTALHEPQPGVMHPVDEAFYSLVVKERDYERVRSDRIERERDAARAEVRHLRARLDLLERRSHPMDFDSPAYD